MDEHIAATPFELDAFPESPVPDAFGDPRSEHFPGDGCDPIVHVRMALPEPPPPPDPVGTPGIWSAGGSGSPRVRPLPARVQMVSITLTSASGGYPHVVTISDLDVTIEGVTEKRLFCTCKGAIHPDRQECWAEKWVRDLLDAIAP